MAWTELEAAKQVAKEKDIPFLLFVTEEYTCQYAGTGTQARKGVRGKSPPATIFDNVDVAELLNKFKLLAVKVPANQANAALLRAYAVNSDRALFVCAPGGQPVACLQGQGLTRENALNMIRWMGRNYKTWKLAHPNAPDFPVAAK